MMRAVPGAAGLRRIVRLFGLLAVASVLAGAAAGVARAEGSAQLYPTDATCAPNSSGGSCRANIEWRTSAYGPATGAQVRRRTFLQVYAAAGEVLVMGSSAVAVGAGDILVFDPGVVTDTDAQPLPFVTTGVNGFRCSDQRASSGIASQGRITTRAQELAGAQAVSGGGNPGGYVPCSYVAPVSGIYGVAFHGPSGDGADVDGSVTAQTDLASASNFDATQATSVAAWDITVRSDVTSTTDLTGRVFTKALVAFTGGNGRPINVSAHVVTPDGFRYRTDTRGLDPNGFAFYGNQLGFLDGDGVSPLYHDAYGTTNSPQLTALAGGVTFAPPAFPIFFGAPANTTLTALGIPLTPTAPTISTLSFAGNVGGSTSSIGVGGTFSYTANMAGVYEIVISRDGVDFDPGASQNRALRGARSAGAQAVVWDGKDNSGADFPVGTNYSVRASLHAGEYHFPLIDAENSTLGGPTFTLLNPPGGVCPFGGSCTTAFFDDRGYTTVGPNAATVGAAPPPDAPLCGAGPPPAPYRSDPVTGFDTSGSLRAFGTDTGGNSNVPCAGSFGDVKGLDMWTFFLSSAASSALDVVDSADLSIVQTHAGSFTVGQGATYTLTVANAGTAASGAVTVADALPAGVTFVSGSGPGWTCGAVGQNVTCTNAAGLASGASSAITLSVSIGPAAAPSVTNTATVSAAVFDPQTSNNSSSAPTTVIPITVTPSSPPVPTPEPPSPPAAEEADLTTTVRGPATAAAGATVALVANVRNNGSGTAVGAQAILTLPSRFSPRSGTIAVDGAPAGGACTVAGRVVTCRLGALAPGAAVRITLQATVAASAASGSSVVRSNATSPVVDPVLTNNPSAWTIRVTRPPPDPPEPELEVSATPAGETVVPGGELRTTVLVQNVGSSVATGVRVCVPAPDDAAFVSATGATFSRGNACWSIARLRNGSSRRFVVVLRVDTTAPPGHLRSVVRVTAARAGTVLKARATARVLRDRPAGRPGGVTG